MTSVSRHKPDSFDGRKEARLLRNSVEISRRALINSVEHGRLNLEVETFKMAEGAGLQRSDDLEALEKYVKRRIRADDKIQSEYSDPVHPYWEYKCATYGIDSFNKRILCPEKFGLVFLESFSGCFCTKYKTYMLDAFDTPEETTAMVEQAHRIGHPFELVFIPEGQEEVVDGLRATGVVKDPRIVMWMNPFIKDPPLEERKDSFRRQMGVNTLDSFDMGALYFTPNEPRLKADLRGSLTGLDLWMDLVCQDNLVKIEYRDKIYQPPYKLISLKKDK